jgi:antitoxin component of MazEF toxin-antitoxin module
MQTNIVQIGNSRGIRIPKPLLIEGGLTGRVDIIVLKDGLKIIPVAPESDVRRLMNYEYLMTMPALSDWDTPEEDKAWAHLQ